MAQVTVTNNTGKNGNHLKLLLSPSALKCVDCCLSWCGHKKIYLQVMIQQAFRECVWKSEVATRRVIFQVTGTNKGALGHLEMSRCLKAQFENSSEEANTVIS